MIRLALAAALALSPFASNLPAAEEVDAETREKYLTSMARQVEGFEARRLSDPEERLTLVPTPLLRFTNPESGVRDGAVFAWADADGRPEAVAQFFVNPLGEYIQEFTSVSADPLVLARGGKPNWSPETPGVEMRPVPDAPEPASTPAGRLRQMRALARTFAASVESRSTPDGPTTTTELRLLPQPIYRYGGPDAGVADGGLFAFVWTTNPEVLLLLEARRTATGLHWQYGFAPTTGYAVRARHGDLEVWSLPDRIYPKHPSKPWFAQMGSP